MEEDESDSRISTITATTIATSSAAAGTTTTTIITTRNSKNSNNNNNPTSPTPTNRKIISYSQPLSNHNPPALGSNPRRSSHRKHSLDDDRSLFYPHYVSSPPPSFYPNLPPLHHHPHSIASSGGSFTLERVMCEYGGAPGTLPELEGNGGNTGVFRVPVRAPVHPARPPALELRPHPSRETQAGSFLRALAANGNQLWAGSESGLTMWNLSEMWGTHAGEVRRGDEDSAPFYETGRTSPVICLAVDHASGFVWSGHKDGKIRSWKMDAGTAAPGSGIEDGSSHDNGGSTNFTVGLSWQAHAKDPVLSMVITSYGDIWTGSEGGSIRVWSWDAIVKSLSLTVEERHMAALLVERSFIDLRNQVTVNGTCPLPASDIKIMVVDKCRSRVWTATSLTFALWDARTRELLKVFSIDGQVETRVEAPPPSSTHESHPNVEDEMKVKFVSGASSKKEKSKDNFFQRSRNALMGAADAVRRVATKGAFVEDNRRISAVSVAADGTIWTGFTNGSLVQWDGTGTRLSELQNQACSVQCICPFADRLWVGYASGSIQVMDLVGNLIGEWLAHSCPVIDMAVAGSYVFSLAHHGGVRGWHLTSPGPTDDILRNELTKRELKYTKMEQIKILAGTWNVGQEKAGPDSLISWLGTAVSDVGLVVVGLQEVEMGAGFLAMSAAKESVGLEGSNNGQWWLDAIGRTLDEGITFQRVGSRQLAGLVIGAWARTDLRQYIGDVDAAAIATGALGRTIGNKGAVGIRMRVYSRAMCFVNSHFAAHLEAVNKRNADFDFIYRGLSFSRPSIGVQGTQAGATSVQLHRAINTNGAQIESTRTPELSEADLVVFMGDFNYRLHSITYDEARDMVSQRCFDWLREKDQLWAEMKAGRVFQGMREAQITFPPTYKFQKHVPGLGGYDSGEKKRIPAWCDRILYRDSRSVSVADCSLRCPVVASITQYEACMDVADSDHKPVRCKFSLEIARTDEFVKRQEYGHIIKFDERIPYLLQDSRNVPETVISTNNIILQNQGTTILRITNNGSNGHAVYNVTCEGEGLVKGDGDESELFSRGSFGFPTWLEVHPAMGIIKPYQTVEVTIHHEEFYTREEFVDGIPQNWWCEDTRDKEVVLLVNVTGTYSTDTGTHRIHVRHCNSSKELCNNSRNDIRGSSSRRNQKNLLQRSDINQLEGSDLPEYSQLRML